MRSSRYAARLRRALRGRRVLVTGASSGIGRAFALGSLGIGEPPCIASAYRDTPSLGPNIPATVARDTSK
jgi:hypothetical protein